MTVEATLLDAATDTKTAADTDTSLLDTPADAKPDGPDGAKPEASPAKPASAEPAKPDPDKPESDAKPADAPKAPEKYADYKAPEGITLDADSISKFDAECKSLNIPQEKRDALLAIQIAHTETQIKQTMDLFQKQIADWTEQTKKELGPDPAKSLAIASKAIDRIFTSPEENKAFRAMMKETGLGNWNLMVKAFQFVGKAISEDRFVEGRPDSKPRKSNEEVLFDHPTSKAALTFQ